jgi:hypothetical protein
MSRTAAAPSRPWGVGLALAGVLLLPVSVARAQFVFAPPVESAGSVLPVPGPIAIGDVDGDGLADLISPFAERPSDGSLAFFPGDGTGAFGPAVPVLWFGVVAQFALADVDGDGALDMVVATGSPPTLHVSRGVGDGSFESPTEYVLGCCSGGPAPVFDIADFEGDGDADILVAQPISFWNPNVWSLLVNDGSGAFTAVRVPDDSSWQRLDAELADVNRDGLADALGSVLVGHQQDDAAVTVQLALPGGGFLQMPALSGLRLVEATDLDGDGRTDLLAVQGGEPPFTWYGVAEGDLAVMLGQGDGTFLPGQVLGLPPGSIVRGTTDLDGDGRFDVLVEHFDTATMSVLRGYGDGTFAAATFAYSWPVDGQQAGHLVLADVDADGRTDVTAQLWESSPSWTSQVGVALNRTYAPGGPLLDLGNALAGSQGVPIQVAEGSLLSGQPFALTLWGAPALAPVQLVTGLSVLGAPFKGGLMLPEPDALLGPFPAGADGMLALASPWPTGLPSGLEIVLQAWFADAGGSAGLASGPGLQLTAP